MELEFPVVDGSEGRGKANVDARRDCGCSGAVTTTMENNACG